VPAWLAADRADALATAARTAPVSHDHPDAVAAPRRRWSRRGWRAMAQIPRRFAGRSQPASATTSASRSRVRHLVQGTVRSALVCALEATGYEDAIRNAVSLGGDTGALACITGGFAEALHGLPPEIGAQARGCLDEALLSVIDRFYRTIDCA
jgi:ADP-ribosyl-[dinitrogen reductase] hydrolase